MLKNIRKSLVGIVATLALAIVPVVAIPAVASAQLNGVTGQGLKCGSNLDATGGNGCNSNVQTGAQNINTIVTKAVNIMSVLVGIVAVVMIIYGGFRYITSGGDSNNVTAAKNTIIYAIVGLVVVALAQFIVQFVLEKVTSI